MNDDFTRYIVEDVLRNVPDVTAKRMFGGHGLFRDGLMFGIISGGQLYFKVGNENQENYEQAGSCPFEYERKGKRVALGYWEVPADVMEDGSRVVEWANQAYRTAGRQKKKKT